MKTNNHILAALEKGLLESSRTNNVLAIVSALVEAGYWIAPLVEEDKSPPKAKAKREAE